MKNLLLTALLLLGSLFPAAASNRVLGEKENGQTVELRAGEKFGVSLPSNPTTGYSWSWKSSSPAVVTDKELAYRSEGSVSGRVGAGGVQSWKFKARQEGRTELLFFYSRAWEKGVAPAKQIHWRILVKP